MKIKITEDRDVLRRVWDEEYADKHLGKVYEATMSEYYEGYAVIEGAKFPPHVYEIIEED